MNNIEILVEKGFHLCFSNGIRDKAEGRKLLEQAASFGRDDALFYLGKSFELDGDYNAAEEVYLRAFEKKYRAAIFRLALLHKKGLIQNIDRGFYLRTIEALSLDGHFPSIALYTNERIRGSYGLAKQGIGLLAFFPNVISFIWNFARDPRGYKFEQ